MTKRSRKKKNPQHTKRRKLLVRQDNRADRTFHGPRNNTPLPPHKIEQSHSAPPPKFGEQVLYFVLPKEVSEDKIGDLAEHYQKLRPKLGIRGARIWYYKEVGLLILRQVPKVIEGALYAWVGELFRSHIK